MRLIPLVLATLLLATAAPAHAAATFKIVGGTEATQGYPHQAEVDVDLGLTGELCGGTLVDPEWVLTAAHCVGDQFTGAQFQPSQFTVRLGSQQLNQGTAHAVDAVYRYPTWDSVNFRGDAALLHLSGAATETPLPVITAATAGAAAPGVQARVTGWGYTSENGVVSSSLREVDVTVRSDAECSNAYPGTIDSAVMFCAGEDAGGKDACQGDSGGPLMVPVAEGFVQAGIVSSGEGCGQPGKYGIYTRLSSAEVQTWLGSLVPKVAADQAAAQELLQRKADISGVFCNRNKCSFDIAFATGGGVVAKLLITRSARRKLGLPSRRVSGGTKDFAGPTETTLALEITGALHRLIRSAGLRSVKATLFLSAQTSSGLRTTVRKNVKIRR